MKQFPPGIRFKYKWRKYQKRVLEELDGHLNDDHLHVVAPPGSGKTVLGLEVALRLNKPTLIVAPTLAIRNQWIQRFCELFLQVQQAPKWISRDIWKPQFLTVVTYQALHAACSKNAADIPENDVEERIEEVVNVEKVGGERGIISLLKYAGIKTIVVDEAHHLKNAWWRSLTKVKHSLMASVVGLTATPPYDVSYAEWQRYLNLNGPVDAEISVPELVLEGNLCPHQDYVMLSRPTLEEQKQIDEHRRRIGKLIDELTSDLELVKAFEGHPIYLQPTENLEWIYKNFEYYAATLIFLNAVGSVVTKTHRDVVGDEELSVPDLDHRWLEILLTFYLYEEDAGFAEFENHREMLLGKLKRNGAIERKSVSLRSSSRINSYLSSSISKLGSIERIVNFEYDHLGDKLRLVILTDYIRKEYLVPTSENRLELTKMGVMPIFEKLRRGNERSIKIGIMTGSLIVVPGSAMDALTEISNSYGIYDIKTKPLPFDGSYQVLELSETLRREVIHIVTRVFQQGGIEVLIGTKSLLGEGWDAPSINSLILASFVGSYVLSNQMRGRAIRTERGNSDKTSNIWHLVCMDPTAIDRGSDFQLMERRFKSFVGVSVGEDVGIENGFSRLRMNTSLEGDIDIETENDTTLSMAGERTELLDKWQSALENGSVMVEEIKVPFPKNKNFKEQKSLYLNKTVGYALFTIAFGMVAFGQNALMELLNLAWRVDDVEGFFYAIIGIGLVGSIIYGRQFIKALRMYVKFRDISKDMKGIGDALVNTLANMGIIKTRRSRLNVRTNVDLFGAVTCSLEGGSTFEKSTFVKSLQEIVDPVDNPRYVIVRKSLFIKLSTQKDYHSLPELIGRKKKFAEYFQKQWSKCVGRCELIYTRSVKGRKLLLIARAHSLAAEFEETERVNKWQ